MSKEEEPLGTVGPLSLIRDYLINEPFLVMNGDILTKCNFKKFFNFGNSVDADLTIGIKEYLTPFRFGNISFSGEYVNGIEEKPQIKTNILAGIYFMKPGIFNSIPSNQFFGMDDLINLMLKNKNNVGKYMINEYWLDIGVIDDYSDVEEAYSSHFK